MTAKEKYEIEERENNWKIEDAIEAFMRYQKIQNEIKDKEKLKKAIKEKSDSLKKLEEEFK